MKGSTILYDNASDLYIPSWTDAPYARQLAREFSVAMSSISINYNSTAVVVGSTYATVERNLLFRGVKNVVTIEPYSVHVEFLSRVRERVSTEWMTPFQTWKIIRASIRNTYFDRECRDTHCYDSLHVMSPSVFSTIESRGRFITDKHELVSTYTFISMMKELYNEHIFPSLIVMDFDGVGSVMLAWGTLRMISDNDYKILFKITDSELSRLSKFKQALEDKCNDEEVVMNQINRNFFLLN